MIIVRSSLRFPSGSSDPEHEKNCAAVLQVGEGSRNLNHTKAGFASLLFPEARKDFFEFRRTSRSEVRGGEERISVLRFPGGSSDPGEEKHKQSVYILLH